MVAERRSGLGTPPVENLGLYNPFTKNFEAEKERVVHWIKVGAKPTVTVHNLLVKKGILDGPKTPVKMKKTIKEEASTGENVPSVSGTEPKKTDAGEVASS